MTYHEAIDTLKRIDRNGITNDKPDTVIDAICKVLDMETINAVPKEALRNALEWVRREYW